MDRRSGDSTGRRARASALTLGRLADGMPGLSPAMGRCLAEGASVVLESAGHRSSVEMLVTGAEQGRYDLIWEAVTEQMRRTWADFAEATELGACGIAVLLIERLTGFVVLERSRKGTGFDYWLGTENPAELLFQVQARLEVSGMLRGTEAQLAWRVERKMEQTRASDDMLLPAWIVVVKFDEPRSRVEHR